ncbi:Z1 domain-containing protein [Labrenzia sp. OB1]|uniref:Z1 domain-containing protein n=1 Tax=Labrenzia sp. OB1 TaxID=1561204 RepID=UPI0007B27345|nr:Z1 domain-containing protein [Labrenzia sp. OB1]KZM48968.1 hypothetical protein OA90_17370 [Labrenzia sp. OB1]
MAQRNYDDVKADILRQLRKGGAATEESVRNEISTLLTAYRAANLVEEIDDEALFFDITTLINIWQADPSVLRDKHRNWLPDWRGEITWGFWNRYREYLEEEKNWSSVVINKLDSVTDSILGDIGNPKESGSWDRRGMVVGDVQSGKTANYTGLVCKATDAGYKLIIVLAGMTNDLRSQTQTRLDTEFLGFESEVGKVQQNGSRIGVGLLPGHDQLIAQPLTFSSKDGDFRKNRSTNIPLGGNPLLLVVKKNKAVLERILAWVEGQAVTNPETGEKLVRDLPLLLLDDEADNASVNTKKEDEDPTAINRVIRRMLKTFAQSSYVGYTATPFANIFILPDDEADPSVHGEDLFPRNFIYYINPPNHYIGAARVFGFPDDVEDLEVEDRSLPLIREAEDAQLAFPPRHSKILQVDQLPNSLLEAVRAFVLICAARAARGRQSVHNSMLIHVTRFNNVQSQVIDLVDTELTSIRRMLEFRTGPQADALLAEIKRLWDKDFVPTTAAVCEKTGDRMLTRLTWEAVEPRLLDAARKIEVRGINGDAGGVLDYEQNKNTGLHVIAVGGDKLSRGLTLEDLSVSYYIRPARNYDTLLQMGRWFGYRPGYLDLCRLYTTNELVEWYQHISVATEELKREFRLMELNKLTPEQYGLKVRTHPAGLNITASNKIRSGQTLQVSFSGQLSQTTVFHKDNGLQERNFARLDSWVSGLGSVYKIVRGNHVWEGLEANQIIDLFEGLSTHPLSRKADTDLLVKYIRKMNRNGELENWTVMLASSQKGLKGSPLIKREIGGLNIGLTKRADPRLSDIHDEKKTRPKDYDKYFMKNSNIIDPKDQYVDLKNEQIDRALEDTIAAWRRGESRAKKEPTEPGGPFIRMRRPAGNGLLLIYPLDYLYIAGKEDPVCETPIVGFAVSFPQSVSQNTAVEYKVNTKYWEDRYGSEDEDEADV